MSSRNISRKASDINKRKSTPVPSSNKTPSSPSGINWNRHSVVLSNATSVEQYGSSSDDDFESLHDERKDDSHTVNDNIHSSTTTQAISSGATVKTKVDVENLSNHNYVTNEMPPVITTPQPPVTSSKSPSASSPLPSSPSSAGNTRNVSVKNSSSPSSSSTTNRMSSNNKHENNQNFSRRNKEEDQILLNRLMNEFESDDSEEDDYNQVMKSKKKNNETNARNAEIKDDLHGYSSEDSLHENDEVAPFISPQVRHEQSSFKDPRSLSNREIFESIQQRNLSSNNWNTSTQEGSISSQQAIVTTNEADEDDDDVLNYDTYRKVNWKNALLSHFCFRCGTFFLSGALIGLTIFLTLWFAI
ncbi:hypothetical protein C9374_013597 [Naegleria lovaniensis]|uniref:Uncharacterized protein n=1 Tax=Naegleria lovaniensis TaxID=51637 RepID=A0AA88H2M0_NAELO|nr:uncharacterized protein C9374_013597 [Naegleria lovaniensis]KAG2392112.1 hypothetical protein C9374_013597 [Naegleria lovaniensis]